MPRLVVFVDGCEEERVMATSTTTSATTESRRQPPQASAHWQFLNHQPGDWVLPDSTCLIQALEKDLDVFESTSIDGSSSNFDESANTFALWSCVFGYCEALTTHKTSGRRHDIFPLPLDALKRLINDEFVPLVESAVARLEANEKFQEKQSSRTPAEEVQDNHRQRIRALSNAIWQQTLPKANIRDELHANSVYICLRGKAVDKKSLDCFGAAVTTIAGLQYLPLPPKSQDKEICVKSYLTLSEDHAYERHEVFSKDDPSEILLQGTCEVAIPGTTKIAKSKRGRDISFTIENRNTAKKSPITPETSWLYMAKQPVVCKTIHMAMVALVGNINPTIEMPSSPTKPTLASGQLYDLKRDLLWMLYDRGHMHEFPFGMMELGDCEEQRESTRGVEEILLSNLNYVRLYQHVPSSITIFKNEQLFLEAMHVNRRHYDEAQVYPYFYAAHFHKDAGKDLDHYEEYRLVEAMSLYARAAYVASRYPYYGSCLQLNKHMTMVASLIAHDILTADRGSESDVCANSKLLPRSWHYETNAVAFGTWLLGFFDSLLYWEESSGESTPFVEILELSHKHSMGKIFSLLPLPVRLKVLDKVKCSSPDENISRQQNCVPLIQCLEHGSISYFSSVRSKRLSQGGILWTALTKEKVAIPEMAMIITMDDTQHECGGTRTSRRSKKLRGV